MKNMTTLFLAQSYQDGWDDYKRSLSRPGFPVWDYVVITASNETQAAAFRAQMQVGIRQPETKSGRIGIVTLFKGIAILMVLAVHAGQRFALPIYLAKLLEFGQMGCQIFFLMSAFTLCLSYANNQVGYFRYLRHRLIRIAKYYWGGILVSIAISALCKVVLGNSLGISTKPLDILVNFCLLNGLVPTAANNLVVRGGWFVGTIVLFYGIFPVLYKLYMRQAPWWERRRKWLFPGLVLTVCVLIQDILWMINPQFKCDGFIYNSLLCQLPCLALGFALYDVVKNKKDGSWWMLPCAVLLIVGSAILFYAELPQKFTIMPFVFTLGVFFLFLHFYTKKGSAWKGNTVIYAYGKQSFGIYLMHTYIVYEFAGAVRTICNIAIPRLPEYLVFLLLVPIICASSYFAGMWFLRLSDWVFAKITNCCFRKKI